MLINVIIDLLNCHSNWSNNHTPLFLLIVSIIIFSQTHNHPHHLFSQTHNPLQISLHLIFSLRRVIHFTAQRAQLRKDFHHSLLFLSTKLRVSLQRKHRILYELLIIGIHRKRRNWQRFRHFRVLQNLLSITSLHFLYFVQKQIILFILVYFAGVSSE